MRKLIIFYTNSCRHCKKLLPQISALYKNQKEKKLEVFAVSLDSVKYGGQNFINNNNINRINVCDTKSWDGKTANDYYIYAAPTMFLVAKKHKRHKKFFELNGLCFLKLKVPSILHPNAPCHLIKVYLHFKKIIRYLLLSENSD